VLTNPQKVRGIEMTNQNNDISPRKIALVAGLGLLIMTIFAISTAAYGPANLIVSGDATANNILTNLSEFRVGIFSYSIVIICDLLVAWALYVFLKPISKSLSSLAALFRIVYAILFATALANYVNVLELLNGAKYLTAFGAGQVNANVMLSLNAFTSGWAIAYIFFGLHLVLVGYLVFKYRAHNYIPKILGIVIVVSGLGYLIQYLGQIVSPSIPQISVILGWGELLLLIWLLVKGVKSEKMEDWHQ
jgi:hypothetical protein